jgi:2-keto-4-pentenoate hydratase/2-oxohepta-3-ene-1,7-dioic acid hydratase in catechol pathway
MQVATTTDQSGSTQAVLIDGDRGFVSARDALGEEFTDALAVIQQKTPDELRARLAELPDSAFTAVSSLSATAPYRKPRMIWGIGLNYREHASDEPASFIKGDQTVIGPNEPITLPWQSNRVTAEAELGLIIGRECRNVSTADALSYVWGVVPILDQTAEDILAKNPRFLTRSKNFPGFFSFGPAITPMDEVLDRFGEIKNVEVATMINGTLHRKNTVANMMFSPEHLVSFHSQVMPLYPGDIISTGTPGAVRLSAGDVAECSIEGVGVLTNPVVNGEPAPANAS